jgi:hypothetical protein
VWSPAGELREPEGRAEPQDLAGRRSGVLSPAGLAVDRRQVRVLPEHAPGVPERPLVAEGGVRTPVRS